MVRRKHSPRGGPEFLRKGGSGEERRGRRPLLGAIMIGFEERVISRATVWCEALNVSSEKNEGTAVVYLPTYPSRECILDLFHLCPLNPSSYLVRISDAPFRGNARSAVTPQPVGIFKRSIHRWKGLDELFPTAQSNESYDDVYRPFFSCFDHLMSHEFA